VGGGTRIRPVKIILEKKQKKPNKDPESPRTFKTGARAKGGPSNPNH